MDFDLTSSWTFFLSVCVQVSRPLKGLPKYTKKEKACQSCWSLSWLASREANKRFRRLRSIILSMSYVASPNNDIVCSKLSMIIASLSKLTKLWSKAIWNRYICLMQAQDFWVSQSSGGRLCDQGEVDSKAVAAFSTIASSKVLPTICRPTANHHQSNHRGLMLPVK